MSSDTHTFVAVSRRKGVAVKFEVRVLHWHQSGNKHPVSWYHKNSVHNSSKVRKDLNFKNFHQWYSEDV